MRSTVTLLALAAAFTISPLTTFAADNLPTYTVKRTTGTLTVDGKLTEADWANAPEITLTKTTDGTPVPLKSTVKALWDDKFFYVGFHFEDPDAWATYLNDEDPLWEQEVAEVFIDPEGKGHSYYEYEINPVGKRVDLFVLNQGPKHNGFYKVWKEWNFSNVMKRVVTVDGDGKTRGTTDKSWTVELAFPFDEMWIAPNIPPKDGEMWRVNFYRIEHPTTNAKDDWYAAWSPTISPSFHTPWQFGKVIFKK